MSVKVKLKMMKKRIEAMSDKLIHVNYCRNNSGLCQVLGLF